MLNTAPGISCLKKFINEILEPAAFSSIFAELKNSEYGTLGIDHFAEQRHKLQTQNVITYSADDIGNKVARYRCLGLSNVYNTSGDHTFHQVERMVQLAAILTAESEDACDIEASLSQILSKVKFSVTDGASNMKNAIEKFGKWRKDITGNNEELMWIHCNAHVIPALDSGTENAMMAIENAIEMKQSVCHDFNKAFIKPSESVVFTIFYALFNNVGPSSKSQDWSCKIQYNAFLKYKGEKEYRFFDPQSSRSGKNVEMGMILAYNFKYLCEFFESTYMPNKMFKVCHLYLTECPVLYEICISMALLYYHLLGPFKNACGAETNFGRLNLSHSKLLSFYKQFVKTIVDLTSDPSPMMALYPLPVVSEYNLNNFSKAHNKIMRYIEIELNQNCDLNFPAIKQVLKLVCEQYLITLHRQVGKFYLETGSIVEKILKDNPTALDGVPTTQLVAEHSVANARRANCEHLNSSTRTISNFQMIKSTPFYNEYLYMSNEDIKSFICTLKKSEQMRIYRNLYAHMAEEERQGCHETYISLVSKRDMFAQKRSALCTQVKEHGGPFSSLAEIADFVQEFSGLDDELRNIISLEIKFQKIIINDRTVDSNLYKAKRKDYKTGKFIKVPLATMIKNLKAIVMPPPSVVSFPKPNGGEIAFKLQSLHTEMKQNYRHRDAPYLSSVTEAGMNCKITSEQSQIQENQDVTFTENLTYVAAFFVDEDREWYPGILTKTVRAKVCGTCKRIKRTNKTFMAHENCYLVRFLETTDDRDIFSMGDNNQYHVHHSQLLTNPKLQYLQLPDVQGCGYKVLNSKEIYASLIENELYKISKGLKETN